MGTQSKNDAFVSKRRKGYLLRVGLAGRGFLSGVFVFVMILSGGVWAVAQTVEEKISDAHLEAAKRTMLAYNFGATNFDNLVRFVGERTKNLLSQSNPDLEKEISAATSEVIKTYSDRKQELQTRLAIVWAKSFSIEELQAISTFYSTDVGIKLSAIAPILSAQGAEIINDFAVRLNQSVLEDVRKSLREKGHNI